MLEIDIAIVSRDAEALGSRFAGLGHIWPVASLREVCAARHHLCVVEQAMLCEEDLALGAVRFAALPLVLVLDPELPVPAEDGLLIDDVVEYEELDTRAFHWRLARLIRRYRRPLSSSFEGGPASVVLRSIIDHSSDRFIVKDLEHRFVMFSQAFADALGLAPEQIVGRDDLEIGTSEAAVLGDPERGYAGSWAQDDAVIASGEAAVEDSPGWRVFSPGRQHKRTERVPLRNVFGEVIALLVKVTDITDRVRAEHTLEAREVMLRRATEKLLDARRAKGRAERAIVAKNRFMAAASHDLRQPLHALGLFLAVLDRRLKVPEEREILQKIQHSSDALSDLFNSLLDISKLDAGVVEVDRRHVPVEELLAVLRDDFTELGARESLAVSVARSDAVIHTDPVLFGRILRNLLQNAIVHTHAGAVTLGCRVRTGLLEIHIKDTGPGIPALEHESIFSEFYQLDTMQDCPTRGLGLGLAIVKRLAALLEVELSFVSVVGRGTTFTVTVPLGERDRIETGDGIHDIARLVGCRVLVVDDEPEILDGFRQMLSEYGCYPVVAATADEAIVKLGVDGLPPDVIVADYRLRVDGNGSDAIAIIRQHFKVAFPAIIVTGDTSAARLHEARESGFPLLQKPVHPSDLLVAMSRALDAVMPGGGGPHAGGPGSGLGQRAE